MADSIHLQIATPERQVVDVSVDEVELPGRDGYLGILPGHAPLLSVLGAGVVTFAAGGRKQFLAVADGGFIEILDNQVRVLAESAVPAAEIDATKAREELTEARAAVEHPGRGIPEGDRSRDAADFEPALARLRNAQACVDAAEHVK